jgi:hypothetical protein
MGQGAAPDASTRRTHPVAGAIEYAGMVDEVRVRVWGLVAGT